MDFPISFWPVHQILLYTFFVSPLSSSISEGGDELLDFGDDNVIGSQPKCELYIKNRTAICAPFSVCVEHFYVKPPTPPEGSKPRESPSSSLS